MRNVNSVWETFYEYCGSYLWVALLSLSIILILCLQKKKDKKIIILYGIISIVVIFNDVSRSLIGKVIDTAMYYRFFWLMPVSLICAYALVLLLTKVKQLWVKISIVALIALGLFTQFNDFSEYTFAKIPDSKYIMSDDILQIADIIQADTQEVPVVAMPLDMECTYRTYDSNVTYGIGRKAYLSFSSNGYEYQENGRYETKKTLARLVNYGSVEDAKQMMEAIEQNQVDYVIVRVEWNLSDYMSTVGCTLVGNSNFYQIYRVQDETKVDEIAIDIDGVQQEKQIIFMSDLHDIQMDDSVQQEYVSTVEERRDNMFLTPNGMSSETYWERLSKQLDSYHADGIVFGGDMIDYVSQTTTGALKEGLDNIQTPYMYLRADHDLGTWYTNGEMDVEDAIVLQKQVAEYADVFVQDYGEFYVLGWNNSTSQMSASALEEIQKVFAEGKPIILATHVPLNSLVDEGLYEASKEADAKNRAKLWGEGCLYEPNEVTQQFIEMVCAKNSPVQAVLCGHLHFKYTTQLVQDIPEYVFAPSFGANIVVISVGDY